MKTNQIMKRDFGGALIEQRTKDSFFNATTLLELYNSNSEKKKRFKDFWENLNTKDFLRSLTRELNGRNSTHLGTCIESDLYETTRGRGGCTWMHPYLFVKFAMWLSSDFEVKVIKWVYDNLIDFRNQAGDYYKEMCSTIMNRYVEYFNDKPDPLVFSTEAKFLNSLVKGKYSSLERNELNEKELDLLNNLQRLNITLINNGLPKQERWEKLRDYSEMYRMIKY